MKTRFWKDLRWVCALCLAVSTATFHLVAQTPLNLTVRVSPGQAQINVTGTVGTICQVQWSDNLSVPGRWFHLDFRVISASTPALVDTNVSAANPRYYRAVLTPSTNLVWVSAGTFTMGSSTDEGLRNPDEIQHSVTISRGFWMEKYLVTQAQYLALVGVNPSFYAPSNGYPLNLSRPVEQVSWVDATNYCALRTAQEQAAGLIPVNYAYRLPTESEWEFADRAGTTTALYLGGSLLSGQANFNGRFGYDSTLGTITNKTGIFYNMTTPVGNYPANPLGLYDMIGNVWEWCQDWYDAYPTASVTDPQGPVTGLERVFRGGACLLQGYYCRSAERFSSTPTNNNNDIGFRVVLARTGP
jgi:formylglycine-generating enzyme required for sulfatase activity